VENEEALETRAIVCKAADLVHHCVNLFLSNGVVSTSIIASSIFLASNKSLGVKEAPIWAVPDLIDDIGFEIDIQGTGNMFSRGSLGEESAKTIIVM